MFSCFTLKTNTLPVSGDSAPPLACPILSSFPHWLLPPVPHYLVCIYIKSVSLCQFSVFCPESCQRISSCSFGTFFPWKSDFLRKSLCLHHFIVIFPVRVIFLCTLMLKNVLIWPLSCEIRAFSLKSESTPERFVPFSCVWCAGTFHIPGPVSWLPAIFLHHMFLRTQERTPCGHHVISAHSTVYDIW